MTSCTRQQLIKHAHHGRVASRVGAALLLMCLVHAGGGSAASENLHAYPALTASAEQWHHVSHTGAHRDGWNSLVEVLLTVELPARPGVTHALVAQGAWCESRDGEPSFEAGTGIFLPVSSLAARRHTRLMNLYYRRAWDDDNSQLKVGQLRLDDDFMVSDYAALFCNAAFGSLPTQVDTPALARSGLVHAYPEYPLAAPGIWFGRHGAREIFLQLGVYSGAVGADEPSNHGYDWGRNHESGAITFLELSLPGHAREANTTRLGASYHSGRHELYTRTDSLASPPSGGGVWNAYIIHDHVLVTDAAHRPVVGLFVRAGCSPMPDRSVVTSYGDGGVNWFGPIPGRRDDVIGLAVAHAHFGRPYRRLTDQRATESVVELTYRATLSAHFSAQADAQWIRPAGASSSNGAPRFTPVLGVRAVVTF